jgi:hypothetical protein
MPNDLYKKADDKTRFRNLVESGPAKPVVAAAVRDPYMEFRGPGDMLREQTENLARRNAKEAGAYRKTPKRSARR